MVRQGLLVKSANVDIRTVIMIFRARTVIENTRLKEKMVSEEMMIWGYKGNPTDNVFLSPDESASILFGVDIHSDISIESKRSHIDAVLQEIEPLRTDGGLFDSITTGRAQSLVEAHERFSKMSRKNVECRYVEPVFPMDVIGIYVILPQGRN